MRARWIFATAWLLLPSAALATSSRLGAPVPYAPLAASARLGALDHDLGLVRDASDAIVFPAAWHGRGGTAWAGEGSWGLAAGKIGGASVGLFGYPGEAVNAFGAAGVGEHLRLGLAARAGLRGSTPGTRWRPAVVLGADWSVNDGLRSETAAEISWNRVRRNDGNVVVHGDATFGRWSGPRASFAVAQRFEISLRGDRALILSGRRSRSDLSETHSIRISSWAPSSIHQLYEITDSGEVSASLRFAAAGGATVWTSVGMRHERTHRAHAGSPRSCKSPWGPGIVNPLIANPAPASAPGCWKFDWPDDLSVTVTEVALPSIAIEAPISEGWTARAGCSMRGVRTRSVFHGYPGTVSYRGDPPVPGDAGSIGGTAAFGLGYRSERLGLDISVEAIPSPAIRAGTEIRFGHAAPGTGERSTP